MSDILNSLMADPDSVLYRLILMLLVFIGAIAALSWLKIMAWKRIEKWAEQSANQWDDALVRALNLPLWFIIVFVSMCIAVSFAPPEVRRHAVVAQGWKVVVALLCFWLVDRLVRVVFSDPHLVPGINRQVRSVLLIFARIIVISIGALIVLDSLGVSITPLLASLGVGSLAVALALQDTLGNVFSGIYILVDQPFRIGDRVRLDDETEGVVIKMGWRTTRIRTFSNVVAVTPNSKIASSRLMNYDMPASDIIVKVEAGVDYDSDLSQVEKITLEVASQIQKTVPGATRSFEPILTFHTFADSSINFSVSLSAESVTDRGLIKHEFIKTLHDRYKRESINIPFPQRVVRVLG